MRLLLLELPQLLRSILEHAARAHGGCEVISGPVGATNWRTGEETSPDVVVLGLMGSEDTMLVAAVLARWPRAQVLTVMASGERASLHELRPRFQTLGQMSPSAIVATLVDAVRRGHATGPTESLT